MDIEGFGVILFVDALGYYRIQYLPSNNQSYSFKIRVNDHLNIKINDTFCR